MLVLGLALLQVVMLGRDAVLVAQGAREGARVAAVSADRAEIETAVAGVGLRPERTRVEIEREGAGGRPVTVRVGYEVPLAVPLLEHVLPPVVTLSSETTTRQEIP